LQLSGIGDPALLDSIGIKTVIPLSGVGKNLQDRYEIGVVNKFNNKFKTYNHIDPGKSYDPGLLEWFDAIQSGNPDSAKYSSTGAVIAFLKRSSYASEVEDPSDLCIFGMPGAFTGYRPGYALDSLVPRCFSWVILKGYSQNKAGKVEITSNSPFERPNISFNYFQEDKDSRDINALQDAVRFVRKINSTHFIAKDQSDVVSMHGVSEMTPGKSPKGHETLIDGDELKDWIRGHAWGHHASCTNKMGVDPAQDDSVIDKDFRVFNTENLRVVDASSFPKIPGLYIATPIYMISEKAADVILADTKKKS
jgi:choline dehydrogenase